MNIKSEIKETKKSLKSYKQKGWNQCIRSLQRKLLFLDRQLNQNKWI